MKLLRVLRTGNGVRAYDKSGKPLSLSEISQFSSLEKIALPAHSLPLKTSTAYRAESTAESRPESHYGHSK